MSRMTWPARVAPWACHARVVYTHGWLGPWPALGVLAALAAFVAHPSLAGLMAALGVAAVLHMVESLLDMAPPVCGCGRRHWGHTHDSDDDSDNGGPGAYGEAA